MRLVVVLALLGTLGLWGWALLAPRKLEPRPLPEWFVGRYEFARYEPPQHEFMNNPLPAGQRLLLTLRPEGTYQWRIQVGRGYEMTRLEGLVVGEGEEALTFTQVAQDGVPRPEAPQRFRVNRGHDAAGPFLQLTADPEGYHFFLRALP